MGKEKLPLFHFRLMLTSLQIFVFPLMAYASSIVSFYPLYNGIKQTQLQFGMTLSI